MVDLYKRLVSWITYTIEQWFWKDIQAQIKDNEEQDEEILGI